MLLIAFCVAGFLVLIASLISTAPSLAESQHDTATLAAVEATRLTRRGIGRLWQLSGNDVWDLSPLCPSPTTRWIRLSFDRCPTRLPDRSAPSSPGDDGGVRDVYGRGA